MANADISATWEYHNGTKHSPESVRANRHVLDWGNQPRPYKLYVHDDPIPLPRQLQASARPALAAIGGRGHPLGRTSVPDLETLTSVLYHSAGITKHLRHPGGVMPFRAASCTGALYHIEIYVVCDELAGLPAGVYQYGAHDHALRRLRVGDYRAALAAATRSEPSISHAPVTLVYTSTFWRNSWKYQARAYRHTFWDSGTIIANTLALAAAHELPAKVVLGFVDREINRLIGVDGEREAAVALVPLGEQAEVPASVADVPALDLETVPLSPREVDYPAIRAFHASSQLETADEVAAWRTVPALPEDPSPTPSPGAVELRPLPSGEEPSEAIEEVIRKRGSSRRFQEASIAFSALSTILASAAAGVPADYLPPSTSSLWDCYLIANGVSDLDSGTCVLDKRGRTLARLRVGSFRREAGFLALAQELGATAAADLYFLTTLDPTLERLGNRGYRAAQLDAAIAAGRIYLAAYALGLGATGLTFFDDEVTRFFSPHAEGKSVMFLMTVGVPAARRGSG